MARDTRLRTKGSITSSYDSELKTVLVTGGCGFIGTNLVKYLSERRYQVRILDNLSTMSRVWNVGSKLPAANAQPSQKNILTSDPVLSTIDLIAGDIRDPQVVEKAVSGQN